MQRRAANAEVMRSNANNNNRHNNNDNITYIDSYGRERQQWKQRMRGDRGKSENVQIVCGGVVYSQKNTEKVNLEWKTVQKNMEKMASFRWLISPLSPHSRGPFESLIIGVKDYLIYVS